MHHSKVNIEGDVIDTTFRANFVCLQGDAMKCEPRYPVRSLHSIRFRRLVEEHKCRNGGSSVRVFNAGQAAIRP